MINYKIPITPHAIRAPAFPVFLLPILSTRPRSSSRRCKTTVRPKIPNGPYLNP